MARREMGRNIRETGRRLDDGRLRKKETVPANLIISTL